jgi:DNA-binding PadR family transcriptional regulator
VITEKKKVRAYYHLEDSGKQYYAEMKADYDIYIDAINQLLTIEVEIHADQKND